jgi:flagellar biosynthesis/type III secretory pathway chaperone
VDPGVCRESLATLLSQEGALLQELAGLLEREHAILVANDMESLDKAMQERQVVVGRLLQIEEDRRALCHAHGKSGDVAGLHELLNWCDPRGSLKARLAETTEGAFRCRTLNDKNGALVLARMRRVEGLLGAITGQRPEAPATYSAKGYTSAPRAGRVLAIEA